MAQNASSDENRDFAFGYNTAEGCECPAVKVGKNPLTDNRVAAVADKYDNLLQQEVGGGTGVVAEPKAKEAWLKILSMYDENLPLTPTEKLEREEARKIAAELGWLDDE